MIRKSSKYNLDLSMKDHLTEHGPYLSDLIQAVIADIYMARCILQTEFSISII